MMAYRGIGRTRGPHRPKLQGGFTTGSDGPCTMQAALWTLLMVATSPHHRWLIDLTADYSLLRRLSSALSGTRRDSDEGYHAFGA